MKHLETLLAIIIIFALVIFVGLIVTLDFSLFRLMFLTSIGRAISLVIAVILYYSIYESHEYKGLYRTSVDSADIDKLVKEITSKNRMVQINKGDNYIRIKKYDN